MSDRTISSFQKVIIHIEHGANIHRGGDEDGDIVWLNIDTIGRFGTPCNVRYGTPLKRYLASTLSLDEKR